MCEAGFQLSSVDYLLAYRSSASAAAVPHHDDASFSFVACMLQIFLRVVVFILAFLTLFLQVLIQKK